MSSVSESGEAASSRQLTRFCQNLLPARQARQRRLAHAPRAVPRYFWAGGAFATLAFFAVFCFLSLFFGLLSPITQSFRDGPIRWRRHRSWPCGSIASLGAAAQYIPDPPIR